MIFLSLSANEHVNFTTLYPSRSLKETPKNKTKTIKNKEEEEKEEEEEDIHTHWWELSIGYAYQYVWAQYKKMLQIKICDKNP